MNAVPPALPLQVPEEDSRRVAQMRPALVKYFQRKTGSAADAEDLAQEVLIRVLGRVDWESAEQARGYIFRTAVNCWRDRHRRLSARVEPVPLEEDQVGADAENGPERVLLYRQELLQVIRGLDELSERTRTVIILIRLEQMRIATVAQMMGISVSAVNKHLARGLAHLARIRALQEQA